MIKRVLLSILLSLGIPSSWAESNHPFVSFLNEFTPKVAEKAKQLNLAFWLLETTGSEDAATLVATLSSELSLVFNDKSTYKKLLKWEKDTSIKDPILKRQLKLLIYSFKEKSISENLVKELSQKEAALSYSYANFRATFKGKNISENEILEVLKQEKDPSIREEVWSASKEIGNALAPQILELVKLRNEAAKSLDYENYFSMQLDFQEVDETALFKLLDQIAIDSGHAYEKAFDFIQKEQSKQFSKPVEELGPWAWSDPFCQEDPLNRLSADALIANTDLIESSRLFYEKMGIDVSPILKRSDLFEREGKNQHAFCINLDRGSDVRTLNNVKQTLKWFETVLHELGHAIYEIGFKPELPWQLRTPPHMITTEAMALMAGRRAYLPSSLSQLPTYNPSQDSLIQEIEKSLTRRQLIFSRWVLVMTYFEREMYRNPDQDLNKLWWETVFKYQKITPPKGREGKNDWAAKYHIGLAPVYYYSYLLGELFASSMEETLSTLTGSKNLDSKKAGEFLQSKLFLPGNSMDWASLIEHVTGKPLSSDAWIHQFAQKD